MEQQNNPIVSPHLLYLLGDQLTETEKLDLYRTLDFSTLTLEAQDQLLNIVKEKVEVVGDEDLSEGGQGLFPGEVTVSEYDQLLTGETLYINMSHKEQIRFKQIVFSVIGALTQEEEKQQEEIMSIPEENRTFEQKQIMQAFSYLPRATLTRDEAHKLAELELADRKKTLSEKDGVIRDGLKGKYLGEYLSDPGEELVNGVSNQIIGLTIDKDDIGDNTPDELIKFK